MKKGLYLLAASGLFFTACQQTELVESQNAAQEVTVELQASMESSSNSRTSFGGEQTDGYRPVVWQENDALSVFMGKPGLASKFTLVDGAGSTEAAFQANVTIWGGIEGGNGGSTFANVAYYPYGENVNVAYDKNNNTYDITAVFPVEQQFMANATFAQNVSPMVAVTENRSSYEMKFKNVGSWLNLYVKGDKKISKVVMKAKNDKIAGEYIVTASNTADPVVTVSEDGINKIVLTCGEEGVQLSNDKATVFTFTTVPFEFEAGEVSFDIYDTEGNYMPDAYVINQTSKFERTKFYNISSQEPVVYDVNETVSALGYTQDENGNILVYSENGLKEALKLAGVANGNTSITITKDLDMTGESWEPIYVDGQKGADIVTLDGDNRTIKGLSAPLFKGGFAGGSGIIIKNLTIEQSKIVSTNSDGSGAFIEASDSQNIISLENCHLKNSSVSGSRTGGLIGWTSGYNNTSDGPVKMNVTIKNCSVEDCIITGTSVGGINGHAGANAWTFSTIENCTVKNCKLNSTDDGEWRVGVVVGTANVGELSISNIIEENNTLTQIEKTAPAGEKRNYFGRFVPSGAGKLIIDGENIVVDLASLTAAINAAAGDYIIAFAADITGNVNILQKESVNITVDGKGYKYDGQIQVNGGGRAAGTETLKFTNINFDTQNSDFTFISAPSKIDEKYNYSHNVTIENCTFTGNKTVGSASFTGTYNFVMKGCTATNMHSILQTQSCDNKVLVENVTVTDCKNGISFGNTAYPTLKNSKINATEYGVRGDGNADRGNLVIENTSIEALKPIIIRKMTTDGYAVALQGNNTLTPATEGDYQIILTNGDDAAEYVLPIGTFTLTGTDSYKIYGLKIAKVGTAVYGNIDDAIANWTNGSTLTLLDDVTLSDVVTLKSTEHHILDLGTYTMTAASGKNAFVIKACGFKDRQERSAITITADVNNPGGINAGNKSIIYYKYDDGGISSYDRPIINIQGGVFTASTSSLGTAGIYTIGSEADKCATLNISGGTFNCSINGSTKSKLLISGGVFHYSVGSQGDSTALRLIWGGRFKSLGFMTADNKNTKFWFGTSMANSNVGLYIDDENYLVVGGPVITEFGEKFAAKATNPTKWSPYLQYSSAAANGLYYTNAEMAIKKHGNKNVVQP